MDSLFPTSARAFPTLRPFQVTAHESLRQGFVEGHRCQMVMAPTGSGKCLGWNTPILMADGSVRSVQDVSVGDRVMGPDGEGRNVLALGRGREQMFRVIPTKGDPYECNASHILSLRKTPGSDCIVLADGSRIERDADFVEVTASVLARSNATAKHCLKGWRAPRIEAFERSIDDDYLVPPYILGAWLGDGTLGMASISKPRCQMVEEWIAYGKSIGYGVTVSDQDRCPTWRLTNGHDGHSYNLVAGALGLAGVLHDKHVPGDYKFGSIETRREILAGLIDSDGHIAAGGCDWITKHERLAQDFAFLCRSLGLACYVSHVQKGIAETGFEGWYWRCGVSGDLSELPMRDKKAAARLQKKRHLVHGIHLEAIGESDYYGFTIDGDGLFLLGDFTVTHNTILALNVIREALAKNRRAVFVCDRTTLINQTSAVADSFGLDHGIIQADHWRAHPWKPFQIASAQTLARRKWPKAEVIVIDECFPGETLVSTPSGPRRIDELRAGDAVMCATGEGRIRSTFSKPSTTFVRVRLSDGSVLECTPDHPVFTEMGWRPAGALGIGARLFREQAVRELWEADYADASTRLQRSDDLRGGDAVQEASVLREILREEDEEPDAQRTSPTEDVGHPSGDRARAADTWRERYGRNGNADSGEAEAGARVEVGVRGQDAPQTGRGLPASLQAGSCAADVADLHRTGWRESRLLVAPSAGPEEGRLASLPRVEGVETVECPGGRTVYNLRVAGHPSYFANGVLVHNCHTQLKAWTDHIQQTDAAVIGLSATPFSKGLGKLFTRLINATTMAQLVESGVLVPMRVLSCTTADMTGAETSGGEWTQNAAAERELRIVGDVVAEWMRFAEGRKTIVFGSTIAHCEELCRSFREQGVSAAVFTSQTEADERAVLLRDFTGEHATLRVLISVEALAKGFDVPDVSCVVDCRPLRKSLSTAIQMWGRGLRSSPGKTDCLARGTLVLTDKGEVPIERVTLEHKVWDGVNFVPHSGAVCKGIQRVIDYDGLVATPNHEVWTDEGWVRIEAAAHRGLRIARTGVGGKPVWLAQDRVADGARERLQPARGSAVRQMSGAALCAVPQHSQAPEHGGLPALQWAAASVGSGMAVPPMPSAIAALHESAGQIVRAVRRTWYRVSVCLRQRGGAVGGGQPGHPGSVAAIGSHGQQRPLRAGQPAMVNAGRKPEQHAGVRREAEVHSLSECAPDGQVCGCDVGSPHTQRDYGRADRRAMGNSVGEAKREVWDVLNAGPLQRFTANGRLVHNCLLLDHSGNIIRFADDFERIYHSGLDSLDDGEKLDKAIRRDEEEAVRPKCPKCGYSPFAKRCMACGHERQAAPVSEALPGVMREVMIGKRKLADDQRHLWEQLATYARQHSAPEKQQGRAWHLYRDMTGQAPPSGWRVERTPDAPITTAVSNEIRRRAIAYSKKRAA